MSELTQMPLPFEAEGCKTCSKCGEVKDVGLFRPRSNACKPCQQVYYRDRHQRLKGKGYALTPRNCRLCNATFTPGNWKSQFCSAPCRRTWGNSRGKEQKRCDICRQVKDLRADYERLASSCKECVAFHEQKMRRCSKCAQVKSWSEFHQRGDAGLPLARCKECDRARGRAYQAQEHIRRLRRERAFRDRYGITVEDYDAMLASQSGACAICRRLSSKRLHVDHDHKTGAVRALLCLPCNALLGQCAEDVERLKSAIQYLERHANGIE